MRSRDIIVGRGTRQAGATDFWVYGLAYNMYVQVTELTIGRSTDWIAWANSRLLDPHPLDMTVRGIFAFLPRLLRMVQTLRPQTQAHAHGAAVAGRRFGTMHYI